MSSTPTINGVVAGICVLRTDEKDRPKGFPINWNHWEFFKHGEKIVMVPKDDKKEKHQFESEEEWKKFIKENPPHKK